MYAGKNSNDISNKLVVFFYVSLELLLYRWIYFEVNGSKGYKFRLSDRAHNFKQKSCKGQMIADKGPNESYKFEKFFYQKLKLK